MTKYYQPNKSLEEEHKKQLNRFKKNQDKIPLLKKNITELKNEQNHSSRKQINQIQKEIDSYENFDDECDYL